MKIGVISAGYGNTQHNSIYCGFFNEKVTTRYCGIVKNGFYSIVPKTIPWKI